MTYSTHALDALHTGETNYAADVSAPVRRTRRRRHAHVMSRSTVGVRITGFGI